jgi:hypothetical protein
MPLLYIIIAIAIACIILYVSMIQKSKKENFNDFKIDESELINENSIRFSKDKQYNDLRGAFAFKDVNYFVKNKDEIFKHYNTDKRIIKFFDENYNTSFERITDKPLEDSDYNINNINNLIKQNIGGNEVGLGYDNASKSSKIYILDKTTIKSLKIIKNKEITSIYNIVPDFDEKKLDKFIGESNTKNVSKHIKKIKVNKNSLERTLEKNKNILVKIIGNANFEEYKKNIVIPNKDNTTEELQLNKLNCYERYDDNTFIGYHFDLTDYNLVIGENKNFIKDLLTDLGYNTENVDSWINGNNNKIAWLSFTKINNVENITIYYRNPTEWVS